MRKLLCAVFVAVIAISFSAACGKKDGADKKKACGEIHERSFSQDGTMPMGIGLMYKDKKDGFVKHCSGGMWKYFKKVHKECVPKEKYEDFEKCTEDILSTVKPE